MKSVKPYWLTVVVGLACGIVFAAALSIPESVPVKEISEYAAKLATTHLENISVVERVLSAAETPESKKLRAENAYMVTDLRSTARALSKLKINYREALGLVTVKMYMPTDGCFKTADARPALARFGVPKADGVFTHTLVASMDIYKISTNTQLIIHMTPNTACLTKIEIKQQQ